MGYPAIIPQGAFVMNPNETPDSIRKKRALVQQMLMPYPIGSRPANIRSSPKRYTGRGGEFIAAIALAWIACTFVFSGKTISGATVAGVWQSLERTGASFMAGYRQALEQRKAKNA